MKNAAMVTIQRILESILVASSSLDHYRSVVLKNLHKTINSIIYSEVHIIHGYVVDTHGNSFGGHGMVTPGRPRNGINCHVRLTCITTWS